MGSFCLGTLVLQDAASVLGIAVLEGLGGGEGVCVQVEEVECEDRCGSLGTRCVFRNVTTAVDGAYAAVCEDACASLDLTIADDGGLALCNALGSNVCLFEEPEGGGVLISIVVLLGKLLAACVIFYLLERFVLKKVFGAFARSLDLFY